MASERIEWFHRLVKIWNSGDFDGFLDALGPDFEFTPDPSFPDTGTYKGDDLRDWMGGWARTWDENELEILGTTESGSTVIVESRWHLTAAAGQKIPLRDFYFVIWFDDDERAKAAAAFFDRDRALEVAAAPPG